MSDVDHVLTGRLKQSYWPEWLQRLTFSRVLSYKPREFCAELDRELDQNYDAGRVHFMLRQLKAGDPLDPIEIEATWHGFSPNGITVLDGHHRLAASVLARKRRIPASVGGLVKARDWLVGTTNVYPFE